MRIVVAVVALGFVACRSGSSDGPPRPSPTKPAADPWAAKPIDAGVESAEARRKRAETALGRVVTLKRSLTELRGESFKRDVPTEYQTTAQFSAYAAREIEKELPPAKTKNVTAALVHIGLLAKPVDLATVEQQAMVTQAAAYYDPAVKKFFLVAVPDNDLMLDSISVHELTHGLQDQYFDLQHYLPSDGSVDDDAQTARRFVVEGEATLTMMMFALHKFVGRGSASPVMLEALHGQMASLAQMDLNALTAMGKEQAMAFAATSPELKKSADAMDDIPPTISAPLFYSYMKGAFLAMVAYEHGGWDGVDTLFRDPPESTEQVLHPETKLYPKRERPHRVTLPKLAGVEELTNNVLGELQWWVYFDLWSPAHADAASTGWGGDRYAVVRNTNGKLIGLFATTWDTPADAKELADAYLATLPVRFPGTKPESGAVRPDGGKVFVRVAGNRVFIVDGAEDEHMLDRLVRDTKFD
jgi:hypothetical protein